ncbi:MAG: response regulator [Myxococcaceae bacterium]|nr:response regulator [Myxococcaceae bacterium]
MAAAPQLAPIPGFSASYPLRSAAPASHWGSAAGRRLLHVTGEASTERPVVLVAEPDERTRSVLVAGLMRAGFEVTAAASGQEALRCLAPDRPLPGMVFAEADLRGGDGFLLCQQIRADQRTADLPVVLLARAPEAWHQELAGGAGADQYLPKPLFLNDVVALARLMAARSSSGARFSADTATLPIAQTLRALLSGVRAGRIELTDTKGWISFRGDRVVDCVYDGRRGEDALRRLLLLGSGGYVVTFGPSLMRATMSFDLEALVRKVLPRLGRWQKLVERSVPQDAVLVVDFRRLRDALSTLPREVNGLIRLFDGRRTVRAIITDSALDEVTALEAVTRLYAMGLVVPVQ